jgi:hypothetical protein
MNTENPREIIAILSQLVAIADPCNAICTEAASVKDTGSLRSRSRHAVIWTGQSNMSTRSETISCTRSPR